MASTARLVVCLPEGWDPDARGFPGEVATRLAGTSAESSGSALSRIEPDAGTLRKQVTGPDRSAVAAELVKTLTALGCPARVHVRR